MSFFSFSPFCPGGSTCSLWYFFYFWMYTMNVMRREGGKYPLEIARDTQLSFKKARQLPSTEATHGKERNSNQDLSERAWLITDLETKKPYFAEWPGSNHQSQGNLRGEFRCCFWQANTIRVQCRSWISRKTSPWFSLYPTTSEVCFTTRVLQNIGMRI